MLLQGRCKSAVAISLLFLSFSFFTAPAFATPTVTAVTSEAISGQGILPNSPLTALLRVQVTFASGDTLTSIEAAVDNYSGTVTGEISELAIYSDTNNDGIFNSGDTRIAYKTDPDLGTAYGGTTIPWSPAFASEAHYGAPSNIWYYFIVIKTSGTIDHADAFRGKFVGITGTPSGNPGTFGGTTSNVVYCECKVVDVYYTKSNASLLPATWNLVTNNAYKTYWKPNYLSYAISQEMTEPDEDDSAGTHIYNLSEAMRYSYLAGNEDTTTDSEAYSNFLKFERRRKLMGMGVLTPVLGIKVAGKNQYQNATYYDTDYFDTMVVQFTDTESANFNPKDMLFDIKLNDPTGSGVAVYQDTNGNHVFDEGTDQVLEMDSFSWSDDEMTLTIHFEEPYYNPYAKIPQVFDADYDILDDIQDAHDTTGVDFFVVLRARPENAQDLDKINYGADFTARVTGMSFIAAKPPEGQFTSYETKEIKAVYELSDYTGTRVDPNSAFRIMGINVNDGGLFETLNKFNFYLKQTGTNFVPGTDLTATGVSVLNRNGITVPTTLSSWSDVIIGTDTWGKVTVTFSPTVAIPNDDTSVDSSGPDYFINLTTSSSFGYKKQIIALIPDNEFIFGTALPSANGTALTTNANVDLGSNSRVYPDIDPSTPKNNPILGNPAVGFSQTATSIAASSAATKIIGIDLADNTTADTVVLKSVVVQIVDTTSGGFAPSDLMPMSVDSAVSGIGLYVGDVARELAFPPTPDFTNTTEDYRRYLLVLKDPLTIPQSPGGDPELYVTLKTSSTISSTDAVLLRIWGSEIKPCSSYGLGFRGKDDSVTDTEARVYGVTGKTQDTVTLNTALDTLGGSSDYSQNWYLVITAGGDNAIGRIYKVTGVIDSAITPDVTVEGIDLNTIGTVTAVKFFKVESTSYHNTNNSFGINSTGGGVPTETVTLSGVSNSTAIVLTWVDGTSGDYTKGFKIERRISGATSWTTIETAKVISTPYTYQYTDTTGLTINYTYEYQVTVVDNSEVSNIISVFFSSFIRKPQNLDWSAGILTVDLDWDWPDGNKTGTGYWEDGFYIERKKESDPDSAYVSIGSTSEPGDRTYVFGSYTDSAFTDSMTRETTHYSYRVRAYRTEDSVVVYSEYSNVVTAEVIPSFGGSGDDVGGGGAVGPLSVGISALLGWWKRRRRDCRVR